MTCNMYCDRVTTTIGPAKNPNLLSSPVKVTHVRDGVSGFLFSTLIPFANKLSSMSFSLSLSRLSNSNVEYERSKEKTEKERVLDFLIFPGHIWYISVRGIRGVYESGWVGSGELKNIQLNPTYHISSIQPNPTHMGRVKPMGWIIFFLLLLLLN